MREFEQKQKLKKRIYSKFTILILLIILFFITKGTYEIWQKDKQSRAILKVEEERFQELEKRKEMLYSKIEYVDSSVGKEELVREKFNVSKEGEKEIFIIEEESAPAPESEPSNLKRFWDGFIDLIGF